MDKKFENIEDFLEDDAFRQWVSRGEEVRNLFWERWLKENPDKSNLLYEAKEILVALKEQDEDWAEEDQFRLLMHLNQKIDSAEDNPVVEIHSDRYAVRRSQFIWLKVSVILLVMIGGAALISEMGLLSEMASEDTQVALWVSKSALPGEKKKLSLPDGSIVILNSGSELRYQQGFGSENRDILLTGESYFEVAKDSLLPFRVYSGAVMTEALGTAFNVSAFPGEEARVKLLEGKVKVELQGNDQEENDRVFLSPGEQASAGMEQFGKEKFDRRTALLWTEGTLFFDDQPWKVVTATLERWYGVEITEKGHIPSEVKVSGEFHRDNLENVLKSISYSFHFDFTIQNKQVTIQFN